MTDPEALGLTVLEAIAGRRSVRAFLPRSVAREDLAHILGAARQAPSGTNTQPWRTYVVQGQVRDRISRDVLAASEAVAQDPAMALQYVEAYRYYPAKWGSPYLERRRENGYGLYGVLGIEKGDKRRMHEQHQRNFEFFGAPVGMFFTIDKGLERGSLLDYGMFLQNVMLAAQAFGLSTCPQAAWNRFASVVLPLVGASDDEVLVCGMSVGYEDGEAVVNRYRAPRVDVAQFVSWIG